MRPLLCGGRGAASASGMISASPVREIHPELSRRLIQGGLPPTGHFTSSSSVLESVFENGVMVLLLSRPEPENWRTGGLRCFRVSGMFESGFLSSPMSSTQRFKEKYQCSMKKERASVRRTEEQFNHSAFTSAAPNENVYHGTQQISSVKYLQTHFTHLNC